MKQTGYQYIVITEVPDTFDLGNLAVAFVVMARQHGDSITVEHYPYPDYLDLRTPVFTLGEILVCSGGRELFGRQRKPSKWGVSYETFEDIDGAIRRAWQVVA